MSTVFAETTSQRIYPKTTRFFLLSVCMILFTLVTMGCARITAPSIPDKIAPKFEYENGYYTYDITFKKGLLRKVPVRGHLTVELFNWDIKDDVNFSNPDSYYKAIKIAEVTYAVDMAKSDSGRIRFDPSRVTKTYISPRYTFNPEDGSSKIVSYNMYKLASGIDEAEAQAAFLSALTSEENQKLSAVLEPLDTAKSKNKTGLFSRIIIFGAGIVLLVIVILLVQSAKNSPATNETSGNGKTITQEQKQKTSSPSATVNNLATKTVKPVENPANPTKDAQTIKQETEENLKKLLAKLALCYKPSLSNYEFYKKISTKFVELMNDKATKFAVQFTSHDKYLEDADLSVLDPFKVLIIVYDRGNNNWSIPYTKSTNNSSPGNIAFIYKKDSVTLELNITGCSYPNDNAHSFCRAWLKEKDCQKEDADQSGGISLHANDQQFWDSNERFPLISQKTGFSVFVKNKLTHEEFFTAYHSALIDDSTLPFFSKKLDALIKKEKEELKQKVDSELDSIL